MIYNILIESESKPYPLPYLSINRALDVGGGGAPMSPVYFKKMAMSPVTILAMFLSILRKPNVACRF